MIDGRQYREDRMRQLDVNAEQYHLMHNHSNEYGAYNPFADVQGHVEMYEVTR